MKELQNVFLNGDFLKANEAKISIFDRGFIFGDGVYEVIPVIFSKLVDREEFWHRFLQSLASCELAFPYSKEEFEEILYTLIAKNKLKEGGLYMQVSRGVASRDFAFTNTAVSIMAFAFKDNLLKNPLANTGVSVISTPDLRWKRRDIKCLSLLGQCMAKERAKKAGAYEAIMVENGLVTEGSSSGIFIIKDGVLITKPLSSEILASIRRGNILELAKQTKLKIEQRAFSLEELLDADEAFICAATLLLIPVIKADDKEIAKGVIGEYTKRLRALYVEKILKEAGV